MTERARFLFGFFVCVKMQRGLDVVAAAALITDEIDFRTFSLIVLANFHDADIDVIAAHEKFIVNHVFHEVRFLLLAEIQTRVPESEICEIIFRWRADVLAPFDVVACGLLNNERIFQMGEVGIDRVDGKSFFAVTSEGIKYFLWICQGTNGGCENVYNIVKDIRAVDVIALDDVAEICL